VLIALPLQLAILEFRERTAGEAKYDFACDIRRDDRFRQAGLEREQPGPIKAKRKKNSDNEPSSLLILFAYGSFLFDNAEFGTSSNMMVIYDRALFLFGKMKKHQIEPQTPLLLAHTASIIDSRAGMVEDMNK
jgi:hypothetical protein